MICVTVAQPRHQDMINEQRRLVDQGARLVELRLDYLGEAIDPARLLANRPCPTIVTVRRPQDGGRWTGSEEARLALLRAAIAAGADYVDLEEDAAVTLPRGGSTKRIVSLHDFQRTPEDLPAIHARLAALDADIVKIATLATRPHDNVRMLRLLRESKSPTIGLCMGDIGAPTRVLAGRCGAAFTFAASHDERAVAPGQLSYQQMTQVYRYEQISEQTEVYGVIGDPIGHSLSPLIHNAAFAALGLNKVYLSFRIPRSDVTEFLDDAGELGLAGLSVTIPHKEAVLAHLTEIDDQVRGIGAANTILFAGAARRGFNTDCRAALDSLAPLFGASAGSHLQLQGKSALVLGAGGAAKAIAYGLIERGANVWLASRTHDRSRALAKQLGCQALEWEGRHAVTPQLLVNCTPLGMHPNVDDTPFDAAYLDSQTVVFDTVYNPEETLLIQQARGKGCRVVTGIEMFIRQAALQFRMFSGHDAPTELMRSVLKRAVGAAKG